MRYNYPILSNNQGAEMAVYEKDVTILGGLNVTVEYTVDGDDPSVGIMSEGVCDWWIVAVNGKAVNPKSAFAHALYNRVYKLSGEEDRLCEKLLDNY